MINSNVILKIISYQIASFTSGNVATLISIQLNQK